MKLNHFAFVVFFVAVFLIVVLKTAARADLDRRTGPPEGVAATSATLADVLALNSRAEGKPLDSFASRTEEWSATLGGLDMTEKSMWRGSDYRSIESYGGFNEQEGRIAGVRWERNVNGIVVIMGGVHPEQDDFDRAMHAVRNGQPDPAVKLLGEVSSPVDAYVVEVRPAGDPPTWLFVDKITGLIVRQEIVYDGIRSTVTNSDFRHIDNVVVPGKVTTTNGDSNQDETETLVSLRLNAPVSPADVNIPTSRKDLVTFPAGVTSVQLPASFPERGDKPVLLDRDFVAPNGSFKAHIVVRIFINGRGLDFALDSGASNILIDSDVAQQIGLKSLGTNGEQRLGEVGPSRILIPEMKIGNLTMKNVAASQTHFSMRTADTEQIVGLLGFDFIASVGLKVDWDKRQLIAYQPDALPMPETSVTIPIRLDDLVPCVTVSVGQVESDRFVVDTGSGGVLIFSDFAQAHPEALLDEGMGREIQTIVPDLSIGVVGGTAKAYPVQARRIVFGVPFSEFLVNVVEPDSHFGYQDIDGLIGYPFLHYFNLYFDYPNSRIVLEPNEEFRNAKHVPQQAH